jgi:hypothetical protein
LQGTWTLLPAVRVSHANSVRAGRTKRLSWIEMSWSVVLTRDCRLVFGRTKVIITFAGRNSMTSWSLRTRYAA